MKVQVQSQVEIQAQAQVQAALGAGRLDVGRKGEVIILQLALGGRVSEQRGGGGRLVGARRHFIY